MTLVRLNVWTDTLYMQQKYYDPTIQSTVNVKKP